MYHIEDYHKVTKKSHFKFTKNDSEKNPSRNLEEAVIGRGFPGQGVPVLFHQEVLATENSRSSSKRTAEKILG